MFGFSPIDLIVILLIVFLIFGVKKLPEIGSGFGKAIKNFKRSISGKDEIDVTPPEPVKIIKKRIKKTSKSRNATKT